MSNGFEPLTGAFHFFADRHRAAAVVEVEWKWRLSIGC
jgi:hypothetical protein